MNRATLVALSAILLSTPVMAASVGETTGVNSVLGIAPKTEDFVKEAATSDMMEIASSQIALQKGNAQEKTFAQQMIADHTKTSAELKAMVGAGTVMGSDKAPVVIPAAPDSSSQKTLDDLNQAKPEDFPATYDPMQLKAHKDAVSLFQRYADGGENPELKAWAGKTLPGLQHHLEMAQMLDGNK